jgi:hypothetical protein
MEQKVEEKAPVTSKERLDAMRALIELDEQRLLTGKDWLYELD